VLEGFTVPAGFEYPADEWRDYRVVVLTGWTFAQIDEADAVRTDWLLATHEAYLAAQAAVRGREDP
jgi:hypothetical protein